MILEVVTDLDSKQIDLLIKNPAKFKDHPLIRYDRHLGKWVFTQDQIEYALLAERILELSADARNSTQLAGLLTHNGFSKNLQAEVATSIVQQVFEPRSIEDSLARCKEIICSVSNIVNTDSLDMPNSHHAFAGQLALLAASRAYARGADRLERTGALLNLLPSGKLKNMQFVGTMSGFDFRDLIISECYFDTVTFTNCRFSATTNFSNCRFAELRAVNCSQFGLVNFDSSNRLDEASKKLISSEMISAGQKTYSEDSLFGDLDYLIRRFLPRETSGFKQIEERNLSRGLIGHSVNKDPIINTLIKHCLNSHLTAGYPVYAVSEESKPDFIFYVGNGVLTGKLANVANELRKKLGLISVE
jgi:hypothetical protein